MYPTTFFHRDNLVPLESEVQKAHKGKEERQVTKAELDPLASGLILDTFVFKHHNIGK